MCSGGRIGGKEARKGKIGFRGQTNDKLFQNYFNIHCFRINILLNMLINMINSCMANIHCLLT
jgi:hypothetical protein